jgi:hypothetical protein
MGVRTAIPIDQYLHTSFPDLDREYREGTLVERTLPDYLHGKGQSLLVLFLVLLRKRLSVFPCVETRMKIRPNVVLIPRRRGVLSDGARAPARDSAAYCRRSPVPRRQNAVSAREEVDSLKIPDLDSSSR